MWGIIFLGLAIVTGIFCIILWLEQTPKWDEDVEL